METCSSQLPRKGCRIAAALHECFGHSECQDSVIRESGFGRQQRDIPPVSPPWMKSKTAARISPMIAPVIFRLHYYFNALQHLPYKIISKNWDDYNNLSKLFSTGSLSKKRVTLDPGLQHNNIQYISATCVDTVNAFRI